MAASALLCETVPMGFMRKRPAAAWTSPRANRLLHRADGESRKRRANRLASWPCATANIVLHHDTLGVEDGLNVGGVVNHLTGESVAAVFSQIARLRLGQTWWPVECDRGGQSARPGRSMGLAVTTGAGAHFARCVVHVVPSACIRWIPGATRCDDPPHRTVCSFRVDEKMISPSGR